MGRNTRALQSLELFSSLALNDRNPLVIGTDATADRRDDTALLIGAPSRQILDRCFVPRDLTLQIVDFERVTTLQSRLFGGERLIVQGEEFGEPTSNLVVRTDVGPDLH